MVNVVEELAEVDRASGGTTKGDILGIGGGYCHNVFLLGSPMDSTAIEHDNLL
jgi:hypothetical protein